MNMMQRIDAATREGVGIGCELMQQRTYDLLAIVLHDPKIMGKDTFSYKRILDVIYGIEDLAKQYKQAWGNITADTDYCRAQIDGALMQIYPKESCVSFEERYPMLNKVKY